MHTDDATATDARQLQDLAHRLGMLEAIETLAAALAEKLASNPETTDAEIERVRRIGDDAHRRRSS